MAALGRYIFSVATAAILFSIIQTMLESKHGSAILVRLIGGIFLTFTVIAPISELDFHSIFEMHLEFASSGSAIAENGISITENHFREIIKDECESYILDKAMSYQSPMDVEVILSQEDMPVPSAVTLKGNVSPYIKSVLSAWIQEEMGIPRENQQWTE